MGIQRLPKPDPRLKRPELKPKNRFRPKDRMTRLRKSMVPGRVCVCVIGPYTSKKLVFLKQLDSGLLLCACLNNSAIRRFPQKWLLATSEKVSLSGAVTGELGSWSDCTFNVLKTESADDSKADDMFNQSETKNVPAEFQSSVDSLVKAVEGCVDDKYMTYYLKARFTLESQLGPHSMVL